MIINKLKKIFYFPVAYYFKFFAKIQLSIWKPTIIVLTGSSGKTTLLHLIESQIQDRAKYSHFANSSYGIPFDILGLRRKNLTVGEWPYLFLAAPFRAFRKPPKEKLYVVEADCDRPNEGKFLANLLTPEITLWTNVSRTHTMNFDSLLTLPIRPPHPPLSPLRERVRVRDVEDLIAYEFGYFLEHTKSLAIVNGDSKLIKEQIPRSRASIKTITQTPYSSSEGVPSGTPESRSLKETSSRQDGYQMVTRQARTISLDIISNYKVFKDHTEFRINGKIYSINALLPKEASLSIQMTLILLDYLKIKPDYSFSKFKLPSGRTSVLKGIKNTTIIDSTYNATPDGMASILNMFELYPSQKKWAVLGDMIELGNEEEEEHEKLADVINAMKLDKIILVGPRLSKYTYPRLLSLPPHPNPLPQRGEGIFTFAPSPLRGEGGVRVKRFLMPKDALDYLLSNIKGHEVILFKGARFLEGIIEHLLIDKNDVKKLCRREKIWQERRRRWKL